MYVVSTVHPFFVVNLGAVNTPLGIQTGPLLSTSRALHSCRHPLHWRQPLMCQISCPHITVVNLKILHWSSLFSSVFVNVSLSIFHFKGALNTPSFILDIILNPSSPITSTILSLYHEKFQAGSFLESLKLPSRLRVCVFLSTWGLQSRAGGRLNSTQVFTDMVFKNFGSGVCT